MVNLVCYNIAVNYTHKGVQVMILDPGAPLNLDKKYLMEFYLKVKDRVLSSILIWKEDT